MKQEIRVVGIDDSPFNKFKKGRVLVIGTIFRGGSFIDGILSTKVNIDGDDSTIKLVRMINSCKFKPQLQAILLDGIAFGGFNVLDINELYKKTRVPVIVVVRRMPNFKKIFETLIKLNKKDKIDLIKKAGQVIKIGKIFVQIKGVDAHKAKEILDITCTRSFIPEPIRIAHLIATGVVNGESKGKA